MVQVPEVRKDTTLPETTQAAALREEKLTGSPELAEALSGTEDPIA